MFNDVERSNTELILAYDTTLEGWSRALDYRDKETEGHSKRVTDITVMIARAMGLSDDELVNVRRGALLHDTGKLGVPDNILLKPGKLTDEEWVIMKKHPSIAYDLISPIPFLKKALDIPYCHHEKWNGTGYPRGLKGEEIPLAARIFSVVDVWDALRSDRPYRPAWSKEKTMEYILQEVGAGFDPKVVEAFLNVMKSESA
jgi:HD-GYP domain-containing protein (c-di-GMP phosphodiesterase class II)